MAISVPNADLGGEQAARALPIFPSRGFLPEEDPITELPAKYRAWDELGKEISKLLAVGRARRMIEALPPLEVDELTTPAMLDRAMLLLGTFAHSAVFETWRTQPGKSIPACVAVPLVEVAKKLGRPPILSYASYVLSNWRRESAEGGITLDNLMVQQHFLGGMDEDWFILSHVAIEALAAPAMTAIAQAEEARQVGDLEALAQSLDEIARAEGELRQQLLRLADGCDPFIFFNRVRPFIDGFQQHPVVYEGVAEMGEEPQRFIGASGAQSAIFALLDSALGVKHEEDALHFYLRELRRYMPRPHVQVLEHVEGLPSLRDFVQQVSASEPRLKESYNKAILSLDQFRSAHIEFAAIYVQGQAGRRGHDVRGTGGTPFMKYLKKHRDETRQCLIE